MISDPDAVPKSMGHSRNVFLSSYAGHLTEEQLIEATKHLLPTK